VLFQSFGESSLDFELRVWVLDADEMLSVKSELHQEIDRCFRETRIQIAFPQRDLHVRSLANRLLHDLRKPPPRLASNGGTLSQLSFLVVNNSDSLLLRLVGFSSSFQILKRKWLDTVKTLPH